MVIENDSSTMALLSYAAYFIINFAEIVEILRHINLIYAGEKFSDIRKFSIKTSFIKC